MEWGQCSSFVPVQEVLGRSQVILPKAALYHRGKRSVPVDYKPRNLFILSCLLHDKYPLASIADRNYGSLCARNYYYFGI